MKTIVYSIIEQTMKNPFDYSEGYALEVVITPHKTMNEALEYLKEIAESTSKAINCGGEYNTIATGNTVIEADTQRIITCYYIQPTTIETFT